MFLGNKIQKSTGSSQDLCSAVYVFYDVGVLKVFVTVVLFPIH